MSDDRYSDFIDQVAQWEGVWALYHNGWLLHTTDDGQKFCPLFASREDAQSWGLSIQTNHVATAITLVEMMEDLIPEWRDQDILPGITPTPALGPVVVDPDRFRSDLLSALKAVMTARFGKKQ
ncbi:MAG: DUF2750 domain-containing protein [Thalassospira sp.]|uniref:DUF2750 domain-containing protein n=1 Tax=Thalassospira sp. TaxID=1912094 RepID=UPI0032EED924